MNLKELHDIEKLEKDLWEAADQLRANSKLTSSDYFMPVLGIIFLRHAANRFDAATKLIEADQKSGKMPKRKVIPADYISRRSLYLPEDARFDNIIIKATNDAKGLPALLTEAMNAIEAVFEPLQKVLPKDYGLFAGEEKTLEDLMRIFNSEIIKNATGDVFGKIYEYFLSNFSMQKAHDNGEFFTPASIVQTIVNVIEPDHGAILDPACGSGGMFVQSSHFMENAGFDTAKKVVFYGQEKNNRALRQKQTCAEEILWEALRDRKSGFKFVRQKPFPVIYYEKKYTFIVDFYCRECRLAVEADGLVHAKRQGYDTLRTTLLDQQHTITIIRFTNSAICDDIAYVVERIKENCIPFFSAPLYVSGEGPGVRHV